MLTRGLYQPTFIILSLVKQEEGHLHPGLSIDLKSLRLLAIMRFKMGTKLRGRTRWLSLPMCRISRGAEMSLFVIRGEGICITAKVSGMI